MTMIGTMMGSGLISTQYAVFLIILGALLGDYLSFFIGVYFKDYFLSLNAVKKRQALMDQLSDFVNKYGALSIIIGRFFGPMRSSVPTVAGLLGMKTAMFTVAVFPLRYCGLLCILYLVF